MHKFLIHGGKFVVAIAASWAIGASLYIFFSPVTISGVTGTDDGLAAAGKIYTDTGVAPGTNPLVDALATNEYAKTASYFVEYAEDIDLLGLSFNTELGTTGVALQGEVSHRSLLSSEGRDRTGYDSAPVPAPTSVVGQLVLSDVRGSAT